MDFRLREKIKVDCRLWTFGPKGQKDWTVDFGLFFKIGKRTDFAHFCRFPTIFCVTFEFFNRQDASWASSHFFKKFKV